MKREKSNRKLKTSKKLKIEKEREITHIDSVSALLFTSDPEALPSDMT